MLSPHLFRSARRNTKLNTSHSGDHKLAEAIEIIHSLGLSIPTGVLQVGANSGQEISYFAENGISLGAFIEPLDEPFQVLKARCASQEGYLPVQALCSSSDGMDVTFHVSSNNGESSSLLRPARHLTDYTWVHFPKTLVIRSFTLDTIFRAIKQSRPEIGNAIDMLFMDVQGAELEVIKGANTVLNQVKYIYTEVGLGGGYENDVILVDLISYLKHYGFDIYNLDIGRTGFGNALFVKRKPGAS